MSTDGERAGGPLYGEEAGMSCLIAFHWEDLVVGALVGWVEAGRPVESSMSRTCHLRSVLKEIIGLSTLESKE